MQDGCRRPGTRRSRHGLPSGSEGGLGVDFGDAPDYVSSNDLGTAVLLAAMADADIRRLVQASSMVVYGEGLYRGPSGLTRPSARRVADLDAGGFDPRADTGEPLTPELIERMPLSTLGTSTRRPS